MIISVLVVFIPCTGSSRKKGGPSLRPRPHGNEARGDAYCKSRKAKWELGNKVEWLKLLFLLISNHLFICFLYVNKHFSCS